MIVSLSPTYASFFPTYPSESFVNGKNYPTVLKKERVLRATPDDRQLMDVRWEQQTTNDKRQTRN